MNADTGLCDGCWWEEEGYAMAGEDGGRDELSLDGGWCIPVAACIDWLPLCVCSAPINAARKAVASGDNACSVGLDCLKWSNSTC